MRRPHAPDALLPEPDDAARAHSGRVRDAIRAALDAGGGFLPLRDFIALALYAPGLGYYVAGAHKLGAAGDFTTAPELTPLFARALASPVAAILESTQAREIVGIAPIIKPIR